ncbi:MAG: isoprenyl transferase [Pseudomonadota bacterium]
MQVSNLKLPEGLRHIAVIMDGNGRWAKQRSKDRVFGHKQGANAVKALAELCAKLKLEVLSLFAFSTENWQRPKREVDTLMKLFAEFLKQQSKNILENNIRFMASGEITRLPDEVQKLIAGLMEKSSRNSGMILNLAVSYGGRQDILQAVKRVNTDIVNKRIEIGDVDVSTFSNYLWTNGLPDPDLLIRTSGEFRMSNFMIWQMAYTEVYITDVLWPDFDKAELAKALEVFAGRKRKFGRVD